MAWPSRSAALQENLIPSCLCLTRYFSTWIAHPHTLLTHFLHTRISKHPRACRHARYSVTLTWARAALPFLARYPPRPRSAPASIQVTTARGTPSTTLCEVVQARLRSDSSRARPLPHLHRASLVAFLVQFSLPLPPILLRTGPTQARLAFPPLCPCWYQIRGFSAGHRIASACQAPQNQTCALGKQKKKPLPAKPEEETTWGKLHRKNTFVLRGVGRYPGVGSVRFLSWANRSFLEALSPGSTTR